MTEVIHDAQVQQSRTKHCLSDVSAGYEKLTPYSQRLEENWDHRLVISTVMGKICWFTANSSAMSLSGCIHLVKGDPMRLLFSFCQSAPRLCCLYTYLEQIWKADAVALRHPRVLEFMVSR